MNDGIEQIVTDYIVAGAPLQPENNFLASLHCPYSGWAGGEVEFTATAITTTERAALQRCLPMLLPLLIGEENYRSYNAGLLFGIQRHGCLSVCVKNESGAHDLALSALLFIDTFYDCPLERFVTAAVIELLNDWIRPRERWSTLPGVVTVCRLLFGDAWCAICLPADCADDVGGYYERSTDYEVHDLIKVMRPPLLPGLCGQEARQPMRLPEIFLAP